jgi:hypothetical protein
MSKCSRCQKDFSPLIKNNGLLYKTCDRCRYTDDKYRDKHKEQIKEYREANKEQRKEYDIYYRELNKDILKEKAKEYREVNKDKISTKLKLDRITCECGCTSRRDKISQHKKSSCHQKLMEEKNKLKRNLTDEELDVFFRTNYPFQFYPQGILITSYSQTM